MSADADPRGTIRGQDLHARSPAAARARGEGWRNREDDLLTYLAIEIVGAISDRDVKRAEQFVARNVQLLKSKWEKLHARRQR